MYIDDEVSGLAGLFISQEESDKTPYLHDFLKTRGKTLANLDVTVDSLGIVEDFLDYIKKKKLKDQEYPLFLLRIGAYVGEVIRYALPGHELHWIDFETGQKLVPQHYTELRPDLIAALYEAPNTFLFPLGKVLKRLEKGKQEDVQFYVKGVIEMLTKSQ